jgi:hypothetical protein
VVASHVSGERIVRHRGSAGQFIVLGHDRIFLRGGRTARVACVQASGVWLDSRVRGRARNRQDEKGRQTASPGVICNDALTPKPVASVQAVH